MILLAALILFGVRIFRPNVTHAPDRRDLCDCGYSVSSLPETFPCPECGKLLVDRTRNVRRSEFDAALFARIIAVLVGGSFAAIAGAVAPTVLWWLLREHWELAWVQNQLSRLVTALVYDSAMSVGLALAGVSALLPRSYRWFRVAAMVSIVLFITIAASYALQGELPVRSFERDTLERRAFTALIVVLAWSLWASRKNNSGPRLEPAA